MLAALLQKNMNFHFRTFKMTRFLWHDVNYKRFMNRLKRSKEIHAGKVSKQEMSVLKKRKKTVKHCYNFYEFRFSINQFLSPQLSLML